MLATNLHKTDILAEIANFSGSVCLAPCINIGDMIRPENIFVWGKRLSLYARKVLFLASKCSRTILTWWDYPFIKSLATRDGLRTQHAFWHFTDFEVIKLELSTAPLPKRRRREWPPCRPKNSTMSLEQEHRLRMGRGQRAAASSEWWIGDTTVRPSIRSQMFCTYVFGHACNLYLSPHSNHNFQTNASIL